jgi:hypothetical protein
MSGGDGGGGQHGGGFTRGGTSRYGDGIALHTRGTSISLDVGVFPRSSSEGTHTRRKSLDIHKRRSSLDILNATPSHRKLGSIDASAAMFGEVSSSLSSSAGAGAHGLAGSHHSVGGGPGGVKRASTHLRQSSLDLLGARQFQPQRVSARKAASWDILLSKTGPRASSYEVLKHKSTTAPPGALIKLYDDNEMITYGLQGDTMKAYLKQVEAENKERNKAKEEKAAAAAEAAAAAAEAKKGPTTAAACTAAAAAAAHEEQDEGGGGGDGGGAEDQSFVSVATAGAGGEKGKKLRHHLPRQSSSSSSAARMASVLNAVVSDDERAQADRLASFCIIAPTSDLRLGWDITILLWLLCVRRSSSRGAARCLSAVVVWRGVVLSVVVWRVLLFSF